MKRIFLFVVFLSGCVLPYTPILSAQEPQKSWVDKSTPFRDKAINDLTISGDKSYLATRSELYVSRDGTERWNSVFSLPAGSNEITCIASSGARDIYVGTKRGLFKSEDGGMNWRNVFKTIIPEKNNILAIATTGLKQGVVLIGTQKGIFLSENAGKNWQDISNVLRDKAARALAINHTGFYAGGDGGLYFTKDKGEHWERLIVSSKAAEESQNEDGEPAQEDPATNKEVRFIVTDNTYIYVALGKAIYYSKLGERQWAAMPGAGLGGYVNFILLSKKEKKLFAATTKGIYEYMEPSLRWECLSSGLPKVNANKLSFESQKEDLLWAATDKGLFRLETSEALGERRVEVERNLKNIFVNMDNEPTYKDLQDAAIRYADVSPEKIKKWYCEARWKALVPRLSFGTSKSRSTKSEIYTSATKEYVVVGPDDVDEDLNVSVTWDLGDFIWNDDMTNIDIRSRLMVQLRNDILDDLRRAYYERKKLVFELAFNPPKDVKTKFEKELRLEELTAAIDSLTGNYLSTRGGKRRIR